LLPILIPSDTALTLEDLASYFIADPAV